MLKFAAALEATKIMPLSSFLTYEEAISTWKIEVFGRKVWTLPRSGIFTNVLISGTRRGIIKNLKKKKKNPQHKN